MQSESVKSLILFVVATVLINAFYIVMASLGINATERYFPLGYAVHVVYYLLLFALTFLFVGKFDLAAVGLKRVPLWGLYLTVGLAFALLNHAVKILMFQGTFLPTTLPTELNIPAYLLLGLLIGLAEESAFRGYILRNFLKKYTPFFALLASSLLFGIYHVNFLSLNYFTLTFWGLYVVQALTGGIFMGVLYFKTGKNLIAPIAYHSSQIFVGQVIGWVPGVDMNFFLAASAIINLIQTAFIVVLPLPGRKSKELPEVP